MCGSSGRWVVCHRVPSWFYSHVIVSLVKRWSLQERAAAACQVGTTAACLCQHYNDVCVCLLFIANVCTVGPTHTPDGGGSAWACGQTTCLTWATGSGCWCQMADGYVDLGLVWSWWSLQISFWWSLFTKLEINSLNFENQQINIVDFTSNMRCFVV